MSKRNALALAALLVAALPGPALAGHQGPADRNANDLNVIVYHPHPDDEGDPWGIPAVDVGGETRVDWMAGFYGGFDFPTAVFDGVEMLEGLPTLEGAGAFQDTYNAYNETFHDRLGREAAVSIFLSVEVLEDSLNVDTTVRPVGLAPADNLVLRFVLYEDDVGFAGGNGIVNHRFVARHLSPSHGFDLAAGEFSIRGAMPVAPFINRDNMGVVAIVQNFNENATVFRHKEVVQSASWTSRQEGPTNQVVRGVLLEMYSATWCASCVYGDSASDSLAHLYGIQSIHAAEKGFEYLRTMDPLRVGFALLLGIAMVIAVVPRKRKEPKP